MRLSSRFILDNLFLLARPSRRRVDDVERRSGPLDRVRPSSAASPSSPGPARCSPQERAQASATLVALIALWSLSAPGFIRHLLTWLVFADAKSRWACSPWPT